MTSFAKPEGLVLEVVLDEVCVKHYNNVNYETLLSH
jgi:hypothetical protein